jgi:protein-tyrosine-phosphatase
MKIEPTSELRTRASLHAALSDPQRLLIVDQLQLGDASPSRLSELLSIASNLLAHHLRVLETVGLLTRVKSEGDRRRSYVRLDTTALDTLWYRPQRTAPRVVFVCTANSARSQFAAALWKRVSQTPVTSAGTHPAAKIHSLTLSTAQRHGLRMTRKRPQQLSEVITDRDLVITVCDSAYEELGGSAPVHWSVPDPVPLGTDTAFDAAFAEIARRVQAVAPLLTVTGAAAT